MRAEALLTATAAALAVAVGPFAWPGAGPGAAFAADLRGDPATYLPLLRALQPGDTLHLAPGVYTDGVPLSDLQGAAGRPIVVEGPAGSPTSSATAGRAVFLARAGLTTVSLRRTSWVVVRDLVLDGQDLPSNAVRSEPDGEWAHHVTIEGLRIVRHGWDQQIVGISTKCPSWEWTIRGNVIVRAGTGLYLGDSDGSDPFIRGVIEHNLVVDPIGYAIQIKHQAPWPFLPDLPQGPGVTVIRHNVLIKSSNASLGTLARPNLLVGHWPVFGPGSTDHYEIYGNLLHANASGTEPLFQGEGNFAFHDNVLINPFGQGLWVQPHNHLPRDVAVFHNTIYTVGRGMLIFGGEPGYTQIAAANAVFTSSTAIETTGLERDNVTGTLAAAETALVAPGFTLGSIDFSPLAGALRGAPADMAPFARYASSTEDFEGARHTPETRGAYATSGAAWVLAAELKPSRTSTASVLASGSPSEPVSASRPPLVQRSDRAVLEALPPFGDCACSASHGARGGGAVWLLLAALLLRNATSGRRGARASGRARAVLTRRAP